jgi:hypothetical protein
MNTENNLDKKPKLAIVIATYYRKNESTKKNLIKMFNFLNNQTYKDFKIFITGDGYEKEEELFEICNKYNNLNISVSNNKKHLRNTFKIKHNKWTCGGMMARLSSLKRAIDEKYDYYLHLDDDDIWTNNYIEEYIKVINKFPTIAFISCKSKYKKIILPREHHKIKVLKPNNWTPKPENSVHSTWCINLNIIGNLIIKLYEKRLQKIIDIENNKIKEIKFNPFDAIILNNIHNLKNKNKINCILIPKILCTKLTDLNIPS